MSAPPARATANTANTAILVRVACAVLVVFMAFFLRLFWMIGRGQLCGGWTGGILCIRWNRRSLTRRQQDEDCSSQHHDRQQRQEYHALPDGGLSGCR
ncbi:hypothetical protein GCM10010306_099020 [Streptomyces umbrinus]|nr:hypothetical protein GCM10010306_099020 [Streptomyces umbrinus]